MLRPSAIFFLPNTTTLLAHTAINHLQGANQEQLDEAIQTLVNRRLPANGVMAHLEQSVRVAEVLEKLARDWAPETVRVFASALQMEASKTDVMDLIVAIAILNEPDLELELRGENTTDATASDLLENRRVIWQHPPPGTPLTPPYVVLVAVEQIDTTVADSEVEAILGALVDYKGYKIARRAPIKIRPGIRISPEILAGMTAVQPTAPPVSETPATGMPPMPIQPLTIPGLTSPASSPAGPGAGRAAIIASAARLPNSLMTASRFRGVI